jgi:membrane-associated protease RseP (regulator of RpoE activity)
MKNRYRNNFMARLLLVLAILLPLAVLFLLPGRALFAAGFWFWIVLIFCFWIIWTMLRGGERAQARPEPGPAKIPLDEQPEPVTRVMNVRVATEENGIRTFRGSLREPAVAAYEELRGSLPRTVVPLLQEDEQMGAAIILMPKRVEEAALEWPVRPWLHWLLLVLTLLTTTWAGAAHAGVNLLREPGRFAVGLPYALGLMAILGVHELAHFFMARWHGIRVTPPYLIPVPFALGTFGAFIQMRSPSEDRRSLFDVGVAGPLAGLAAAIPALLIGLKTSTVVAGNVSTPGMMMGGTSVGSSLLFAFLSKLSLGPALQTGHVLRLSPLAFAGWLGLLVTALNLLPIGQLDGGHVAHALFGRRIGHTISTVSLMLLFLLALFVWPGLMLWAILVFFVAGGRSDLPLDDLTPLTPGRRWLGYATFALLLVILIPLPHAAWSTAGIRCPYA